MVCEGSALDDEALLLANPADGGDDRKAHGGCGARQPSIKKEGLKLIASYKQSQDEEATKQVLTADKVYAILKRISDEDCWLMGLNPDWARPDWMMITVLPVPPPPVRPSIQVDGSSRGEDDLTYKLADIIKASQSLKRHETEGAPGHIVAEFEQLLQYHVVTYMDNDTAGLPQATQKSGRPVRLPVLVSLIVCFRSNPFELVLKVKKVGFVAISWASVWIFPHVPSSPVIPIYRWIKWVCRGALQRHLLFLKS
jgi:DNA-directed RNA polymerase II subunit RPB1